MPCPRPNVRLLEYALDAVTREQDGTSPQRMATPTLSSVLEAMGRPQQWQHRLASLNYDTSTFAADSRRVRLALERLVSGVLGGIFDGPVTTNARIDFTAPGAILDLRAVRASDQMTAMAMTCAQSWLEAELTSPHAPSRLCIYDEFALIARHLGLVRRMREQLKLARAMGTANLLAFHRFSDLAASGSADSEQVRIARGLIEDTGVRVSYRQSAGVAGRRPRVSGHHRRGNRSAALPAPGRRVVEDRHPLVRDQAPAVDL